MQRRHISVQLWSAHLAFRNAKFVMASASAAKRQKTMPQFGSDPPSDLTAQWLLSTGKVEETRLALVNRLEECSTCCASREHRDALQVVYEFLELNRDLSNNIALLLVNDLCKALVANGVKFPEVSGELHETHSKSKKDKSATQPATKASK